MPREEVGNEYLLKIRKQYDFVCEKFKDRNDVTQHEYPRHGADQGLVIIFNQETFENKTIGERYGTVKDVNNIVNTLNRLGYNIDRNYIFTDYDRIQILDKISEIIGNNVNSDEAVPTNQYLKNAGKVDFSDKNSLIVIFLTHGDVNGILHTRMGILTIAEVYKPFADCQDLAGKPKMFIFQACKGDDPGVYEGKSAPSQPITSILLSEQPSDLLLYFAAVEGAASIRDPFKGTWLINELCKNLAMYGRKEDVIGILQRTSKCVATFEADIRSQKHKQMPVIVSTLTKKFYFTNSKDQRTAYATTANAKSIKESLQEFKDLLRSLQGEIQSANADY